MYHIIGLLKMTAEPHPIIFLILKLIRATLLKSDLRIIKCLKILVQIVLPLLVLFSEEPVDVHQHIVIDVLKIVVVCNVTN